MLEYRKGRPEDAEAIIDLANLVFSHDHCPHDFPTLLPKLFSAANFVPEYHYIAVQDGKVRACIGSYPNEQSVCGHLLRSRDIGTVSVHPYARREGHMRKLMAMVQEDMAREGADLSWLGGQRQRYGYLDYEHAGMGYVFTVTRTNARHALPGRQAAWAIRPLEDGAPELEAAKALHDRQPVHFIRDKFYDVLRTWENRPLGFFDQNGALCGYAVVSKDGSNVPELVLADGADTNEAILALLGQSERLVFSVPLWRNDLQQALYALCEDYRVTTLEQCRINCFRNVLNAALALRGMMPDAALLPSCAFDVHIPETNETLRIRWADGKGEALPIERTTNTLVLSRKEAESLFFAPASLFLKQAKLPAASFSLLPLPLTLPSPDAV